MLNRYQQVRLFLFASSYSSRKIIGYINGSSQSRKRPALIKKLASVLDFDHRTLNNLIFFGINPDCPYRRLPQSLQAFLEVERELSKLTEERLDEYSTALEDYHRQLLAPAIERTAGNSLTDVRSDRRFQEKLEEKIREYTRNYYKVAYKYKLPTIRIVPFILRLIS